MNEKGRRSSKGEHRNAGEPRGRPKVDRMRGELPDKRVVPSSESPRRGDSRDARSSSPSRSRKPIPTRGDASNYTRNPRRDFDGSRTRRRGADETSSSSSPPQEMLPRRKGWGSVARKGAFIVGSGDIGRDSAIEAERRERPRPEKSEWRMIREDIAPGRKRAARSPVHESIRLSPEAIVEIEERVGAKRSSRLVRYLRDAARAYAAERWPDVRKALRPLLQEVPDAPSVQELSGMTFYRTGKWAAACKELEASHSQTLSFDLYPAIMDCRRALRQGKAVEALWQELRDVSPSGEVLAEGRIVYASYLADSGRLQDALRLMEKTPKPRKDPKIYHLRSWYVLADLCERSGDVGTARMWFGRVASVAPDMADVLERLDALE